MKKFFLKNCWLLCFFVNSALAADFHKEVVVIVDGISVGVHLAPLFRGNGYDVIHIQSVLGKNLGHSFRKEDYSICFEEDDNLVAKLNGLNANIKTIIPGSEAGVDLAEKLKAKFKLPGNKIELIHTRRNKFYMQETLRKANIR